MFSLLYCPSPSFKKYDFLLSTLKSAILFLSFIVCFYVFKKFGFCIFANRFKFVVAGLRNIVRFKKDSRLKTHFVVMLTYSLGEFLIILGLILR